MSTAPFDPSAPVVPHNPDGADGHAPVLVVDDDPLMRRMAVRTLQHAGLAAEGVGSGEEALARIAVQWPALLLLDVLMPGLDGYEVCQRVRALPQGATLPVIMLTGLNEVDSIDEAYRAGATDFIAKPIHWTLLAQRVRYALRAAAAADSAARNRERLERAQRMAAMGHWEMLDGGTRFVGSPALAGILGRWPGVADAGAMSPQAFAARVHPDDRARVLAAREAAHQRGEPYRLTYRLLRADAAERTVFEQAEPLHDAAGRLLGVEGFTQDITERVEAERRLAHLARHDPVTGLANRLWFEERAAPALARARHAGQVCALLHVDLDRFKAINDAFGQDAGDGVLREISLRLQDSIRPGDLAGSVVAVEPALARVGANAFTLLAVDCGADRHAAQIAARLLEVIAQPLVVQARALVLSASVGIAMFPRDAGEPRTLAQCAEQAAYDGKRSGGACVRFFDAATNAESALRLQLEAELRRALAADELVLYYQPKVDATDGRIVGSEALVRWMHPRRGLMLPSEFVPLAEESGLIGALTDWVLAAACRDQQRRRATGLPVLPVAVNLSGANLVDPTLAARLAALVVQHGLEPNALALEVTETALMKDPESAARHLEALRQAGFSLSLDDFGTGYSSLSYLRRFAVHELKIDRSFVADTPAGGGRGAIARAVIALAHEFRLEVVAEGVETGAQSRFLLRQGCRVQQGYRFARPLPVADFDALLASGAPLLEPAADEADPDEADPEVAG